MTDIYIEDDQAIDDGQQAATETHNEVPKQLRDAAERGRAALNENKALKRENAFLKAGINVDDPRMSYFFKGYDGELTADAILTAAKAAGFIAEQKQDPQTSADLASEQRVVAASSGGAAETATFQAAAQQMSEVLTQGGSQALAQLLAQQGVPTTFEG